MAKIEKYGAAGVYDPPGYSQGIRVTGAQTILFTAGQVPYDANGGVKHRGDFKAQARAVFAAIQALVEAGGGTLDHVVKITTYVTDVRYRLDFRSVREEFFGAKGPASTMVEVALSRLGFDRDRKGSLYARAGLADYGIVNLPDRRLEVYRGPVPDGAALFGWRYGSAQALGPDERISPLALRDAAVTVADLLP